MTELRTAEQMKRDLVRAVQYTIWDPIWSLFLIAGMTALIFLNKGNTGTVALVLNCLYTLVLIAASWYLAAWGWWLTGKARAILARAAGETGSDSTGV